VRRPDDVENQWHCRETDADKADELAATATIDIELNPYV
jgi:hypothetical protein